MNKPGNQFYKYVPSIFKNLPEIVSVSEELLGKLKVRIEAPSWSEAQCLADIFLEMVLDYCYS